MWRPSPMLILILILALPNVVQVWREHFGKKNGESPVGSLPSGYYDAPFELKFKYGACYLGLAAFLAIMCYELSEMLPRTGGAS